MKLSHDDPSIVWVSSQASERGNGTYDDPFGTVDLALRRASPGYTIALREGAYRGDLTVQISGLLDQPVRIMAEPGATVEIVESCWFFYDTCDLIVSGFVFSRAPNSALAVIGKCERNCFSGIRFLDCGGSTKWPCTMYFGGSGARHNVVENCHFEGAALRGEGGAGANAVGIMIAEGDDEEGALSNRTHVLRGNVLRNYGYGILVGSRGVSDGLYGHVVEGNSVLGVSNDGIKVMCGDTTVRANRLEGCGGAGISIAAGRSSTVADNRVETCETGVRIAGSGHMVQNNCLVGCRQEAVAAPSVGDGQTSMTMIEENTCFDCGTGAGGVAGLRLGSAASCVVRCNVFHGPGNPYVVEKDSSLGEIGRLHVAPLIEANIVSGRCAAAEGCETGTVGFTDPAKGDYSNDTAYGSHGWAASPAATDLTAISAEPDQSGTTSEGGDGSPRPVEQLIEDLDRGELISRSLFFDAPPAQPPSTNDS